MAQQPDRSGHANAGPTKVAVIRIVGLADGTPTTYDGQYIVEYDTSRAGTDPVTGRPMQQFHVVTTPDIERATRFTPSEVVALSRAVDRRQPTRPLGRPIRPLTAFAVEIESADEAAHATDRPPAGWYVDPNNP